MNNNGAIAKKVKEVFEECFENVILTQYMDTKSNNNALFVTITGFSINIAKVIGYAEFNGSAEDLIVKLKTKSTDLYSINTIEVLENEHNLSWQFKFEIMLSQDLFSLANTKVTEIIDI